MKRSIKILAVSALAVTTIAIVHAQGPGGFPPGGPGGPGGFQPGGPGGFQPGGPGGRGGGRGGFGRGNMVAGTVSAVNVQAGTITVSGGAGGNTPDQVILIPPAATVTAQVTIKVADLKRGDDIQVTGTPTAITFSSLTAGQAPAPGGGFGGGAFAAPGAAPKATAFASANGVVSLSPLTLWVDKDTPIALKMAADAKVTKFTTGTLATVKAGDNVMIAGQTGADGNFSATSVGVNMTSPFGGGFGRGGGFGGGFNVGGGGGRGGFGRRNRAVDPNAVPNDGAPPPPAPGQ